MSRVNAHTHARGGGGGDSTSVECLFSILNSPPTRGDPPIGKGKPPPERAGKTPGRGTPVVGTGTAGAARGNAVPGTGSAVLGRGAAAEAAVAGDPVSGRAGRVGREALGRDRGVAARVEFESKIEAKELEQN
jgi:hypothetical protein